MNSRTKKYVIGMDCGTTNMKAVVLGGDGMVAAKASLPNTPIVMSNGRAEQNADKWWEDACILFRKLAKEAGAEIWSRICGISISSHTVSMLPVDEEGRALHNAMTYQDCRSVKEMDSILESVGEERFTKMVGGKPSPSFLPSKIKWFKEHEPKKFGQTRYFLQASSYLNLKLTGIATCDLDQATRTQCMDINSMRWSREIAEAIGIDLNAYLPKPMASDEIIGTVTKEASVQSGIPEGVSVVAGCSDAMAAMYAMGLRDLGDAGESSGTSSLVFVGSEKKSAPDVPVVTRPSAVEGIPWIFDAPITTTGAAVKWFMENVFHAGRNAEAGRNDFDELNAMALQAKPGCGGLFFYPYLMGERAPLWNTYARGMFIGMGISTETKEMARAVFEGTAYAIRHVLATVRASGGRATSFRVCGGGAKSRTWSMIKASVLNMPVYVMDEASTDVPIGDALLAGQKLGIFEDSQTDVRQIVRVKEIIEPNPEWVSVYNRLYPYYLEMYQRLDASLKGLHRIVEAMHVSGD